VDRDDEEIKGRAGRRHAALAAVAVLLMVVGAAGGEQRAQIRQRRRRDREALGLRERAHEGADRFGVASVGLVQQPLEIRGDLDIHRGRG